MRTCVEHEELSDFAGARRSYLIPPVEYSGGGKHCCLCIASCVGYRKIMRAER